MTKLKAELLKGLRGKRTQGAVSRRLGYEFNQVYRWESGKKRIKWNEFVNLSSACRRDLAKALAKSILYFGDIRRADLILMHLIGNKQASQVIKTLGLSRFSFQNWKSGFVQR